MLGMVIGTRPELIKLLPIYRDLRVRRIPARIIFTGQHPDLHSAIVEACGREPFTDVSGASTDALTLAEYLQRRLDPKAWQAILVQGDTNSAVAGALVAAYGRIPVIHVEAGLRTYADDPHPEELNRQLISRMATLHLAPNHWNAESLRSSRTSGKVFVTGNPGISVVAEWLARAQRQRVHMARERTILVTCHRRENWDRIETLVDELLLLADRVRGRHSILLVGHLNHALQDRITRKLIAADPPRDPSGLLEMSLNLYYQPPLQHEKLLEELQEAALVVTDSGGIIEEATYLGKRLCVLRAVTERPEATASYAQIAPGLHEKLLAALRQAPAMEASRFVFGDRNSATNCVDAIEKFYKELTK